MSRLRDHRPRMDTSICPDPDGCARLFHGSLVSGLLDLDCCECCGAEVGNTPRTPSFKEWRAVWLEMRDAQDAAAYFGVHAARPPSLDYELVGWTWERGAQVLFLHPREAIQSPTPPDRMRPIFAPLPSKE